VVTIFDKCPFVAAKNVVYPSWSGNRKATVLGTGEALHYQALSHTFLPRRATSFDDLQLTRSEIQLH
jgi:hypothetical protein